MEEKCFEGKKALVFGGTSSIGFQLALLLEKEGAEVTVTGRHKIENDETEGKKSSIKSLVLNAESQGLDFIYSNKEFLEKLEESDILCLCYGPFVYKSFEETLPSEWEKLALYDYALPGTLVSLALKKMKERKYGRILFFGGSHTDKIRPFKKNAAYAAIKTALNVLALSIAENYGMYDIRANVICPGFVTNPPFGAAVMKAEYVAEKAMKILSSCKNGEVVSC